MGQMKRDRRSSDAARYEGIRWPDRDISMALWVKAEGGNRGCCRGRRRQGRNGGGWVG